MPSLGKRLRSSLNRTELPEPLSSSLKSSLLRRAAAEPKSRTLKRVLLWFSLVSLVSGLLGLTRG